MFILKISNTIVSGVSSSIPANYNNRKIDFVSLTTLPTTINANLKWQISSDNIDNDTKKPLKESITTKNGKNIECIVFRISYVSTTVIDMNVREFYMRIYDANVTISKVFLAIVEEDIGKIAKIDFVGEKNDNEIDTTNSINIFKRTPTQADLTGSLDCDILNKSYLINKNFNQFDVVIFKLAIPQTLGARQVYSFLQDYNSFNKSDRDQEDNTPNSKPTFMDFISIYQDLLHSDPDAEAEKWQLLIDSETEIQEKYKKVINEFKDYIKKFSANLNNHASDIKKISDK